MAVVKANLSKQTAGIDQDLIASYTDTYSVVTDDYADNQVTAIAGVAAVSGSPFPGDPFAILVNKTASLRNQGNAGRRQWDVVCEYKYVNDEWNTAPWNKPTIQEWTTAKYEVECRRTIQNKPIVNAAKCPFGELIMKQSSRICLTLTKSLQSFPVGLWNYEDCTNSNAFMGAPAKTVIVEDLQVHEILDDKWGKYWEQTAVLGFQGTGYKKSIANYGKMVLVNNKLKNITVGGVKITEPVALTQDGSGVLPIGTPPIFLDFEIYNSTDLSGLL